MLHEFWDVRYNALKTKQETQNCYLNVVGLFLSIYLFCISTNRITYINSISSNFSSTVRHHRISQLFFCFSRLFSRILAFVQQQQQQNRSILHILLGVFLAILIAFVFDSLWRMERCCSHFEHEKKWQKLGGILSPKNEWKWGEKKERIKHQLKANNTHTHTLSHSRDLSFCVCIWLR